MISSVYSYYLSQYGHKANSKYDSHTRSQLKNTYSKVVRVNSQTPTYKLDVTEAAQKYAIDLKENARELSNIASELSDADSGTMTFKKSAISSNPDAVSAEFIGNNGSVDGFEVSVKQLASNQVNTGNYLQPNSKLIQPGDYSFDLSINNLTYEFQFNVDENESTNDIQNKLSRLINRSNIGLIASVIEDSLGNTALSIESEATGLPGIKPTIFNIRANNDRQINNPDFVEGFDKPTTEKNDFLINTLGLERVTQYPGNAIFAINGEERFSPGNDITINKAYVLSFHNTTEEPVTVSLKADVDSIAESINELISGYNKLISVATDESNDRFDGNVKLRKEIAAIARTYKEQLNSNGLTVNDDGSIEVNKNAVLKAANENSINGIFESLDSFKNAIQSKAEDISVNPMNYVNNKIVAYKNPHRTITDPYNLSAYSGMMFNGYI
ncbi:MAG: hypothetical protein ACI4D4_00470 [Lachnospira sp.]